MLFFLPRLAVCVSAVLFNSVSACTHTVVDPGFLQCKDCFFRGTPPPSLAEVGLEQRCHRQLTGRPFASIFNPGCQTTVYTALHLCLVNGWGRGEQDKQDAKEQINEDSPVAIPSLYAGTTVEIQSSSNSPFLKWDALTAGLIRSSVVPKCAKTSGEIYVQTGVGRFNECGGKMLWSAVCCAAADGDNSFSVGLVNEGEVRVVSVKALEELMGVKGLFSGGCGEKGDQREQLMSLFKEQLNTKAQNSDAQSEKHVAQHNDPKAETSDSGKEEVTSRHINVEEKSYRSSLKSEMDLQESTNETKRESVVLYVLSSTISLLYTPFSPIVNRVINFPSQVAYVLQEDLAVLAAVPGDSLTLVNNLVSGVLTWVSRVFKALYKTVEVTACTLYSCISPLVGSLLLAFQEGFVGMATLAWYALCIMANIVCNCLKVCLMLLGLVWDQIVDFLCAVSSELGHQVSAMGCGIGTLTWRSGRGVGHVLKMVASIVWGVVENTLGNIQEAFGWGGSSKLQMPEIQAPELQTPEVQTPEVQTPKVAGE